MELQGNVEVRDVRLAFEVSGRISKMLVDEGARVQAGQQVATLDPRYFEDAVRQAEASLAAKEAELLSLQNGSRAEEIAQARANTQAALVTFQNQQKEYKRARQLFASNAVPRERFDNARAAVERAEALWKAAAANQELAEAGPRSEDIVRAEALVAQAQSLVEEARRRRQDTSLYAPSGGIVQTRVREPGDFVGVGEPVYTITISNPVWVRSYINETDLGRIQPGMAVVVHTDAGRSYKGHVGFISPAAEFTPKTVQTREIRTDLVYRIRVVVSDDRGELRQGMPVSVTMDLSVQAKG